MEKTSAALTVMAISNTVCSPFLTLPTPRVQRQRIANRSFPGAPEACHHNDFTSRGTNRIDFPADIFSFGAITSEVFTWVVSGYGGILEYFKFRKQATDQIEAFEGSGYAGCFHNGVGPLPEVSQIHQKVRAELPTDDQITPKMIDLVEGRMLVEEGRNTAITLVKHFDNIYQEAKRLMCADHPDLVCLISPIRSSPSSPQDSIPPATPIASWQGHTACGMKGHYRSMSDESSVGVTSPVSSPSSIFSTPYRPESAQTLDGVQEANGQVVCPSSCDPLVRERPGPSPLVTGVACNSTVELPASEDVPPRTPVSQDPAGTTENHLLEVPELNGPVSRRTSTSSAPKKPDLRLRHLQQYRNYKKRIRSETPISPDVLKDMEFLQRDIKNRDHIFYIDDSNTMAVYKTKVEKAFALMSYFAKQVDENGVELVFGSNADKLFNNKHTSELSKKLQKQQFETGHDLMEHHFEKFVDKILIPRLKRRLGPKRDLSVLVFTDGCWGNDAEKAAGVENPVRRLIETILEQRIGRTRVMISFVQFGDDPFGKQHLKYLDDFGKSLSNDEPNGSSSW